MSDGGGAGGGGAAPRAHGLQRCLMASYGEAVVSDGGRTGVTSARARSPKESAVLKGLTNCNYLKEVRGPRVDGAEFTQFLI